MERFDVSLHASRIAYHRVGAGPTVLLIHGLAQSSATWRPLVPLLADQADLIAPDLPGHGESAPPAGDHSLGAYATMLRDLLLALDRPNATIVGHSLGGGVALQFTHQFPQMVERLVLIDSGGLGSDLSPLLRAATLPGAHAVLGVASRPQVNAVVRRGASLLFWMSRSSGTDTDLDMTLESILRLADQDARDSFLRTVQAVIELSGQAVSAQGKLYLMAQLPTLIIWGADDHIIPLGHAISAHRVLTASRLKVVEGAGHFPHIDATEEVADSIAHFLRDTEPATIRDADLARLIRAGGAPGAIHGPPAPVQDLDSESA